MAQAVPAPTNTPEPGPQKGKVTVATASVQDLRRMRPILREEVNRFNHELMDDEERQLLLDRIRTLRKRIEQAEA